MNKAMVWTKVALEDIIKKMPVRVRKIYSDNGSEFINGHVERFFCENGIGFTRSRPYRKRVRGKFIRQYEMDTPLNRVLRVTEDEKTKEHFKALRQHIDIVSLSREIERLSEELSLVYENKLRRFNNA